MNLRSITIRGFKSFAAKTTFLFEPGITVIVGPNGSGKSNITDAVLWVLGEQKSRLLRGTVMEDVIFAGSVGKKALGMADVSLSLDNSDGSIPIDFSEVTITRKLFRSGESEYLINKTPCRLVDIQELLSDTGLGRELYSVISQGRLDDVLNCGPLERRRLLEEAAGVLKHKRRRDRALKKLVSMETNLSRARDVLREATRQLQPLKRQADQARRHRDLSQELKEVQIAGAVSRLRRLQLDWDRLEKEQAVKEKTARGLEAELEKEAARITEMEKEIEEKGFLVGDIGEYRRRVVGLQERINSGLLLLEEKGKNLIGKLSEFRQAIHRHESQIDKILSEQLALQKDKEELDDEVDGLYKRFARAGREAESAKKMSKLAERELEEAVGASEADRGRASEGQAEHRRSLSLKEALEEEVSFLARQERELAKKSSSARCRKEEMTKDRQRLEIEIGLLESEKDKLRSEISKTAETEKNIIDRIAGLKEDIRRLRSEKDAINMTRRQNGSKSSWALDHKEDLPAAAKRLVDVIKVEKKYKKAIETALGLEINAIVMTDADQALETYNLMSSKDARAFRLLTEGGLVRQIKSPRGIKKAVDLVDCPRAYRPIVGNLLANIWIAPDVADFLTSRERVPPGVLIIDVNGGYLDYRGPIGRQSPDNSGPEAERRIRKLDRDTQEISGKLDGVEAELKEVRDRSARESQQFDSAGNKAKKAEAELTKTDLHQRHLEEEIERLRSSAEEIVARLRQKKHALDGTNARLKNLAVEMGQSTSQLQAVEMAMREKRAEHIERLGDEQARQKNLAEVKISMASLNERQAHVKKRLTNFDGELQKSRSQLEQVKVMAAATEQLRSRIQPVHDLYSELRLSADTRAAELEKTAQDEQAEGALLRKDLRYKQRQTQEKRADLDLARKELSDRELEKGRLETEVSQITKYIVEDLQAPIETALDCAGEQHDIEEWRARETRIREEIERIGPVNQIANEDFEKLEKRQSFLTGQIDDLVKSHKALKTVVKAINQKIEDGFESTFGRVNQNFSLVFERLFPGGSAQLALIKEEDGPGDQGVEILAQPYGKRLQSLSLLSGGEKSLVGLAFLFALYHTRPSPFYILDEAEAALDDINLSRFIGLLDELKKERQFIIITHQRRTMATADSVFGVTMQADGVSKVISKKLSQLEAADDGRAETGVVAAALGQSDQVS